jgi:hypothetical protein
MMELLYEIPLENETQEVVDRFEEMLRIVNCNFTHKDGIDAVYVPRNKGVAMMNLLTNIGNNRK